MPEVLEVKRHKARQEHICDYCDQKITIGETYESQTCVNTDRIYRWKSHLSCLEIVHKLHMFSDFWYDEGLTAENFRDYVDEFLKEQNVFPENWSERIAKAKEILCKPKETQPCQETA